jgi:DNA-binding NarL/FixJ family response regulator
MNTALCCRDETQLCVLLVGSSGLASAALASWLADQNAAAIVGPAITLDQMLELGRRFRPHLVLLDFHGLPIAIAAAASRLKELTPMPRIVVLTHDGSDAMRRRCRAACVDAVFDKTSELDAMADLLRDLRQSLP